MAGTGPPSCGWATTGLRLATGVTMSLDARFALLLAPFFAVLDANAARALENADFAGLVNIGGGRRIYLDRVYE